MRGLLLCLCLLVGSLAAAPPATKPCRSPKALRSLYNSLNPNSIAEHLAFYELYGDTAQGKKALTDLYRLLTRGNAAIADNIPFQASLSSALQGIVNLVNKTSGDPLPELTDHELQVIEKLACRLPNRQLAGYGSMSEEAVLRLESEQIDLARAMLISQMGNSAEALRKICSYEAVIDLMALQILSYLPPHATPRQKIREINRLVFEEIGFRFPPHSTYSKDVDLYTFLPSVLDSRRGVCLGVSLLYLALAQRLDLALEIITPPGHIFVSYRKGDEVINIETTSRGVHLPDEEYLGVDTRSLQRRNLRDTLGLSWFNQAAVYWEREEYEKAFQAYTRAEVYLPDDPYLMELKGCCALIMGREALAKQLLEQTADFCPDHAVSAHTIARDYLNGAVGVEGIKNLFIPVDETRASLLSKKEALQQTIGRYPKFREGLFSLAGTWLQLHRTREALQALESYHALDGDNASVEYYLAALYAERHDYNRAWTHLRLAEKLAEQRDHHPKALAELRRELVQLCPE